MDIITMERDVVAVYMTAASFPDGILDAHQRLHRIVPFSTERRYYGISRPEKGGDIVYRSAAEILSPNEPEQFNLPTIVLKKGRYRRIIIENYIHDLPSIGKAFDAMLAHPDIDPKGYCLEWYITGKDVHCMVRLQDEAA